MGSVIEKVQSEKLICVADELSVALALEQFANEYTGQNRSSEYKLQVAE